MSALISRLRCRLIAAARRGEHGLHRPREASWLIPLDTHRLSSPRIYLLRMAVFVVLAGLRGADPLPADLEAFLANPGLNGVIIGVLFIGIILAFRQVIRLFREVRWVNALPHVRAGPAAARSRRCC